MTELKQALDDRNISFRVGDTVLVLGMDSTIQVGGVKITADRSFLSTYDVGKVIAIRDYGGGFAEMGSKIECVVNSDGQIIRVEGDSENGWFEPIYKLVESN